MVKLYAGDNRLDRALEETLSRINKFLEDLEKYIEENDFRDEEGYFEVTMKGHRIYEDVEKLMRKHGITPVLPRGIERNDHHVVAAGIPEPVFIPLIVEIPGVPSGKFGRFKAPRVLAVKLIDPTTTHLLLVGKDREEVVRIAREHYNIEGDNVMEEVEKIYERVNASSHTARMFM